MPRRLAVACAMIAFAVCLICGMEAGNSLAETIRRALLAMFVTLVVGLIVTLMGQRMLQENLKQLEKKAQVLETKPPVKDR